MASPMDDSVFHWFRSIHDLRKFHLCFYAVLDMRKAKRSSKLSPISSKARTTRGKSKPFITSSCTVGGYSSTVPIAAAGKLSSRLAATDATDAAAAGGMLASPTLQVLGREATAFCRKELVRHKGKRPRETISKIFNVHLATDVVH